MYEEDIKSMKEQIYFNIRYYLTQAVYKRCTSTERPIACLLSGGLDSSLIAALVSQFYAESGNGIQLETFSIGLKDSEDLKYARIVARYLNTSHTEIILTEEDFITAIPDVVRDIESYDTTTVRASIGNYKLGEYISKNSLAKVIFNGDGSDELCGGYLYMENCPSPIEFDKECRRLLNEIYLFDVLRSDKCISSHGLEPRTPFLDKSWVQYYLSIPPDIRMPKRKIEEGEKQCTKYLLRKSFSGSNQILPDEILWRRKEAFSDGVSKMEKSLYQIIQESDAVSNTLLEKDNIGINIPLEKEKKYYKNIFMSLYPNSNIISHYWMPKYTDPSITDASARMLKNYTST
jgi:asparagine synthase (glutamine-hydrolysing)